MKTQGKREARRPVSFDASLGAAKPVDCDYKVTNPL
jgi:hypothetical protein